MWHAYSEFWLAIMREIWPDAELGDCFVATDEQSRQLGILNRQSRFQHLSHTNVHAPMRWRNIAPIAQKKHYTTRIVPVIPLPG